MILVYTLIIILIVWACYLHGKISDISNILQDIQNNMHKYYRKLNTLEKELKKLKNPVSEKSPDDTNIEKNADIQQKIPVIESKEYQETFIFDEQEQTQEVKSLKYREITVKNTGAKTSGDFEDIFLGNIFTIIGVIAIITGFILFIIRISSFIIFTPFLKTSIGFITGIAMILSSLYMKKDSLKNYSEIMIGTGISILLTTVYLSTALFKTFSPAVCLIIASLILIFAYYTADKQKTISMITIALTGGYLNLVFSGVFSNINLAFAYIIFLNCLSVIYVYKNPDKAVINIINLTAAFFCSYIYAIPSLLFKNSSFNLNLAYPLILWGIYLIYEIIRKNKNPQAFDRINLLNWFNFGVLTLLSLLIFRDEKIYIGRFLLFVGLMYSGIILYFVKTKLKNYRSYVYSMLITIFLSNFFMTENLPRIIIWSVEALTLSYILYKYKQYYLVNWILSFITAAMINVFFVEGVVSGYSDYFPILNNRFLTFISPVLTALFVYLLIKNIDSEEVKKSSEIIRFSYISMIYLFIIFEINNFINFKILSFNTNEHFITYMLYAIIGFRYSVQTDKISMINGSNLFKAAGIVISLISLFIILTIGYNYNPIVSFIPVLNIRFIAYASAIAAAIGCFRRHNLDIYKYLGVIIGFILIHIEIKDCIEKFHLDNFSYLISVSWLLYAAVITITGILHKQKYLKNTGICISILALIRIFLFDMTNVDGLYRLITLLALGIIFMFTSYFYNKNKN